MVVAVHPLADEWTDEYALYTLDHRRASYSRPLWHFLADCRANHVRPVILTGADVTITPHLYTAMVDSGAMWAFRDDSGVFDARSGLRIRAISELWNGSSTNERHAAINDSDPLIPTLFFDIYAGDRAVAETRIGPLADHAVGGLYGGSLARAGRQEPLTGIWDHGEVTRVARAQMPSADPILASSDADSWASITVARTRSGLIERVHGGVPIRALASTPVPLLRDHVMPVVTTMLTQLVEQFRPRVALVSAGMLREGADGLGFRVGGQPVDAPLAMLIGARAVRDLDLDIDALSRNHDITVLGPGRVPSVLVRMTGKSDLWAQLRAFAFDLDQERIAAAFGRDIQGWA